MKELQSVKFWLFDLDNTLYSGQTKVFEQVDKKMSKYISQKLNIDCYKVDSDSYLSLPAETDLIDWHRDGAFQLNTESINLRFIATGMRLEDTLFNVA